MFKKLRHNLNLLMDEARLNAEELSRRIELPASTIKKIRNNDDANPTLATLVPIANYFSLSISQLIGDEPFPATRRKGAYKIDPAKLYHLPLITWEDAITWPKINQLPDAFVFTEHKYSKHAFALLVQEDDWENLAKDTALLIDPAISIEHRDFVIVHKKGQTTPALRQVLFDEGETYLKPVTKGYHVTGLTTDHTILGVVSEYKKYLKKIVSVTINESIQHDK